MEGAALWPPLLSLGPHPDRRPASGSDPPPHSPCHKGLSTPPGRGSVTLPRSDLRGQGLLLRAELWGPCSSVFNFVILPHLLPQHPEPCPRLGTGGLALVPPPHTYTLILPFTLHLCSEWKYCHNQPGPRVLRKASGLLPIRGLRPSRQEISLPLCSPTRSGASLCSGPGSFRLTPRRNGPASKPKSLLPLSFLCRQTVLCVVYAVHSRHIFLASSGPMLQ